MDQKSCIACKGCGKKAEYILKHFGQPTSEVCKKSYTTEELSSFKMESKRRSDEKRKKRQKLNYDSAKRADRYQNDKEKIAKHYDSVQRAEKYKSDKENNKRI